MKRYVQLRRNVDARRARDLAAIRSQLEKLKPLHHPPAPAAAPASAHAPVDLASRLAKLRGRAGDDQTPSAAAAPCGGAPAQPTPPTPASAMQLARLQQLVVQGEDVIGRGIKWAASQVDPAYSASSRAMVKPILAWYLDLRSVADAALDTS